MENLKLRFWWAVHNIIAHPLYEVLSWVGVKRVGEWFHDWTLPEHDHVNGEQDSLS